MSIVMKSTTPSIDKIFQAVHDGKVSPDDLTELYRYDAISVLTLVSCLLAALVDEVKTAREAIENAAVRASAIRVVPSRSVVRSRVGSVFGDQVSRPTRVQHTSSTEDDVIRSFEDAAFQNKMILSKERRIRFYTVLRECLTDIFFGR